MSDSERMEEARQIMEAFKRQTQMGQNTPQPIRSNSPVGEFDNQGGQFGKPGDGNNIGMGFDNQGPQDTSLQMQQRRNHSPQAMPVTPQHHGAPILNRPDVCPQCKTMHPPLRQGEKCPNVGVGNTLKDIGIDDTVINKHIVDLKNIIMSQMTSKGIKDGKKFLQYSVIELTKALEQYNE